MINDHLTLSDKGLALLKDIEQCRLYPYHDQTGERVHSWIKHATIGYGHLIHRSAWDVFKHGINHNHAETLLSCDIKPVEHAIKDAVTVALNQHEFDALVLLCFNIGVSALKQSSVIRMINDPRVVTIYATLELAWKAWDKSNGKKNQGLVNRRNCEWDIFTHGIYQRW